MCIYIMKVYALSALVAIVSVVIYYYRSYIQKEGPRARNLKVFTADELQQYSGDGVKSTGTEPLEKPIYLAVMGKVFDVSKGRRFYAEGGGYSFFTGIDGTRAFVSGNFTKEGLRDDIEDFDDEQLLGVEHWISFYESKSEGKYFLAGYLVGRYYDSNGQPTPVLENILIRLARAKERREKKKAYHKVVPSCDSHWEQGKGTTYKCSESKRSPRKETFPGEKTPRCACILIDGTVEGANVLKGEHVLTAVYDGCDPSSSTCNVPSKD